ncbi:flagella basal body P-ring formation protein FlgA [Tunturiibacter gelidiferens]|uniref:flagella basal body P-ring formation protein FlgA n=1 Tax=Tunturiibacter gelidiferens TaxID=3069689 RepID=UPI003D9AC6E3
MFDTFSVFKKIGKSFFVLVHGIWFANTALAICYKTPIDAIAGDVGSSSYSILKDGGYRVARIQSDPVLQQSWAMIIHCGHPGWPAVALPLHDSILPIQLREQESPNNIPASVVIRTGEIVRLWRQERSLRIEVAGISEGNGGLGDLIKVRLLRRSTDDQTTAEQFSGIVRGRSDVEMKP